MGYFSNVAIEIGFQNDWETLVPRTAAERTIAWLACRWVLLERIDDLEQRLEDLQAEIRGCYCIVPTSDHPREETEDAMGLFIDETEFVLPEHLHTVDDVMKAIRFTTGKIEEMDRKEKEAREREVSAEIVQIPGQMVLALA